MSRFFKKKFKNLLILTILTLFDEIVMTIECHCSKFFILFIEEIKTSDQDLLKTTKSLKIDLETAENDQFVKKSYIFVI